MPIPESQTSMRAGEGTESTVLYHHSSAAWYVLFNTEAFSSDSQAQGIHIESLSTFMCKCSSKRNAVTFSNQ
jgi:hypothetical protein